MIKKTAYLIFNIAVYQLFVFVLIPWLVEKTVGVGEVDLGNFLTSVVLFRASPAGIAYCLYLIVAYIIYFFYSYYQSYRLFETVRYAAMAFILGLFVSTIGGLVFYW